MTPPSSIVIRTIMLLLLLGSRTRPEAAGTNHTHSRARPSRRSAGSARRRKPAGSLPTFYHTFACMERGSLFSRFFGALGLASLAPLSGANNAGAGFRQPPQRDPIFRDAKFFCFGAINNRRNYWWGISFLSSHEKGGAFEPTGFYTCQLLISIPVWCGQDCYKYVFD